MSSCPWLLAGWLRNILIDLMACWFVGNLLLVFVFANFLRWNVCWLARSWLLVRRVFFEFRRGRGQSFLVAETVIWEAWGLDCGTRGIDFVT